MERRAGHPTSDIRRTAVRRQLGTAARSPSRHRRISLLGASPIWLPWFLPLFGRMLTQRGSRSPRSRPRSCSRSFTRSCPRHLMEALTHPCRRWRHPVPLTPPRRCPSHCHPSTATHAVARNDTSGLCRSHNPCLTETCNGFDGDSEPPSGRQRPQAQIQGLRLPEVAATAPLPVRPQRDRFCTDTALGTDSGFFFFSLPSSYSGPILAETEDRLAGLCLVSSKPNQATPRATRI